MTVLGKFAFDDWVIEVESMPTLWGTILYCRRVDVTPEVHVAEYGPAKLRITSWVHLDGHRFEQALNRFLAAPAPSAHHGT